ncbi:MAG: hypothetical protein ISR76_01380 [Planctomycetes bacterium]|nr:hypothetical protein [Planctomycetota bacterium]MBL7007621.1 hypothetical protein [Planctomycetota bacterium]
MHGARTHLRALSSAATAAGAAGSPGGNSRPGCSRIRPPLLLGPPAAAVSSSRPFGAAYTDVSEFLLGDVAVGVLLMESNGAFEPESEDWDPAEVAVQLAGIVDGMDFWTLRSSGWTRILLRVVSPAITGYEPIRHVSDDELLFTEEVLGRLGFHYSGPWGAHYLAMHRLMRDFSTQWAGLYFVADSSNDLDGAFADGYSDYDYFGGPQVMTTSTHGGDGAIHTQTYAAHEFAHLFYADDEYYSARVPCTSRSGYLGIQNQNSDFGSCLLRIDCIMKDGYLPATDSCDYSLDQAGFEDADGDGIPTILDTQPLAELLLQPSKIYGRATVQPLPNQNPWSTNGSVMSINTIEGMVWRLDGGLWKLATPLDGAYDSGMEVVQIPHPGVGPHLIEAVTRNSAGNLSPVVALTIP